ncbi:MAG: hypothetical protein NTY16_04365 [Deltaproteobacteria bacterium]|nr:hypothetical protein [Deltaproteobacteria bacterium]
MKYIIAIIQPHKLEEVKQALEDVEVNLMTVSNVLGRGRQKGLTEYYRGAKEVGSLLKKVKLEIAVNEDFVEPTVNAIIKILKSLVADYEKKMIFAALARTGGNQIQAAKLLGTTKRILTYKVHKYAMDTEQFRP